MSAGSGKPSCTAAAIRARRICLAATAALLFVIAQAAGGELVALIYDVTGATDPSVQPYSEIYSGQTIELHPSGRLHFVHYVTCRAAIVVGGKIEFSAVNYFVARGRTETETQEDCPSIVPVPTKDIVGSGGVMRGNLDLEVPDRPNFLQSELQIGVIADWSSTLFLLRIY
jgi:hypothetical protein